MSLNLDAGFTPIIPFTHEDGDNPLDTRVKSDHCEVSVRSSNGYVVTAYNISNPAYHKFFSKDNSAIFAQTHLANTEKSYLDRKVEQQSTMLANRLLSGEVSVQVVVEGYETFFNGIEKKLSSGNFHVLAEKPEGWSETKNITGIVVNTEEFKVCEAKVITVDYVDSENNGRTSTLRVPYVQLQNLDSKEQLVVAGVHVPGASSQYPIDGLTELGKVIDELWKKFKVDVVAIGDFNSTPVRVAPHVGGTVLEPDYFTHANPRFAAASVYDMGILKKGEESSATFDMLSSSEISIESQKLAEGLANSVIS